MRSLFGLFAAAAIACFANANAAPIDHLAGLAGDYFKLDSENVGRPYHIYVRLPEDYDPASKKYPVVYLLDGDIAFPIIGAYHLLLHYDEPVPEAIIVGISYGSFDPNKGNYRSVDYSTPPLEDGDLEGGAAAYQTFLADELFPAIETRYAADPAKRILVGQSRGAHFVLYSAISRPDLFWGRIASNPSLNPNREFFFQSLAEMAPADSNLFFSSGSRDRESLRAGALELFDHFEHEPEKPWRLKTVTLESETHAAGFVNVYREGMIWLFSTDTESHE